MKRHILFVYKISTFPQIGKEKKGMFLIYPLKENY